MTRIAELPSALAHADRLLIDGEWVAPSSSATIEVIDSSTELPWVRVAAAQEADMSQSFQASSLVAGGRSISSSSIGGIRETQEMLGFYAEHRILPEIETIGADDVDVTYDRVVANDVHRFLIDTSTTPLPDLRSWDRTTRPTIQPT